MPTLYGIISDLRREHQSPAAARTLDMVSSELGRTQDNLRQALVRLDTHAVPESGRPVLDELSQRAQAAGLDNLLVPVSAEERKAAEETIGPSQVGIAMVLALSTLVPIVLVAVAIVVAVK
ncbi:MAG: hypothetical protein M3024_07960 [Candidatus Dormibacteraeota bacterium]|nr:hypothetical protein [Candidatus Dormibacteraeota bacterium]